MGSENWFGGSRLDGLVVGLGELRAFAMKKLEIVLKCFGVFIGIVGFFVSQADQVPWLLRILSPEYLEGMEGLSTLRNKSPLCPNDKGFAALSNIIMKHEQETDPSKDVGIIRVKKFSHMGSISGKHKGKSADALTLISFDLSDGGGGVETIGSLRIKLEQFRMNKTFRWMAFLLFVAIGFVEVPSIVIDWVTAGKERHLSISKPVSAKEQQCQS